MSEHKHGRIQLSPPAVVVTKLDHFLVTYKEPCGFGGFTQTVIGWFDSFDEAMKKTIGFVKENDCDLHYSDG